MNSYNGKIKGAVARRRAVLVAPFSLFLLSVFLVFSFLIQSFVFDNSLFKAVFAEDNADYGKGGYISKDKLLRPVEPETDSEVSVVAPVLPPAEVEEELFSYLDELPPLAENGYIREKDVGGFPLGSMWATLSVHGDGLLEEVPVYQGDNTAILSKGIGHLYGSSFPGEGGVCVLAAHVSGKAGFFGNIADDTLYKKGTQIKLDTAYGVYVYEVIHTEILNYQNEKYVKKYSYKDGALVNNFDKLNASFGTDELLAMYTCYPAGTSFRTQRYYLICRRVYGYSWR